MGIVSTATMSRTLVLARSEPEDLAGTVDVTIVNGEAAGRVARVELPATIGRGPIANVRLADPTASSLHVELLPARGAILVRDLESVNGTSCGGVFLREAIVPSGTEILVGSTVVRIELAALRGAAPEIAEHGRLRSASPAMRGVLALLARVSPMDVSVLVEDVDPSECDLVALAIHETSGRAGPFTTVDCASLAPKIGESLLAGALAESATVHLRSVQSLAPQLQAAIASAPGAARIIASSSGELALAVNRGTFHEDLYDRVAKVRVRIPPLAERDEDIPAIVYETLQAIATDVPAARTIAREAMQLLRARDWPGGPRELREVVLRAAMVAAGPTIAVSDLAFERVLDRARYDVSMPFKDAKRTLVDDFEKTYLAALLERSGKNLTRAAIASGIERHHLRDLLKKHGLYDG
jgi:DNA-binding NtrC family response regulator